MFLPISPMAQQTLFSFDVFDTVMSRSYAAPEDLIFELGERLVETGIAMDAGAFAAARLSAERTAWERVRYRRAIDIELIYEILAEQLGWPDAARDRSMAMEIALERQAARAVQPTIALLEQRRHAGGSICFVSDMHLHAEHIRDMLQSVGAWRAGDALYVSSDHDATKVHRGALFRRMLRDFKLPGWRVSHVGDSPRADLLMPRAHLMRARLFTGARLTAAEQLLLHRLPPADRRLRKLAVVSKFTRLRELAAGEPSPATATLCDSVAPFVAAYALWLIARARRDGISKLLFLARDMQIVCKVTATLARRLHPSLECVYAHASRAAWQPTAFDGSPADLFWITDQLRPRTPSQALLRVLDRQALDDLRRSGLRVDDARSSELDRSLRELVETPVCKKAIASAVERRRDLLLEYLEQLEFDPGGGCALVDAGWRGSLQRALARALEHAGKPSRVLGYYIGLRHAGAPQADGPMQPFLDGNLVASLGYSLVALTEAFLAADHGTTLSYERGPDGRVVPLMADPPRGEARAQVAAVASACMTYVEELLACEATEGRLESLPEILAGPFLQLCAKPPMADASALRQWAFDAGREQVRFVRIAAPLGFRDVGKILVGALRGRGEGDLYLTGPWVRGSLALTNPLLRRALEFTMRRSHVDGGSLQRSERRDSIAGANSNATTLADPQ